MKDSQKTKAQLLEELASVRERLAQMETSRAHFHSLVDAAFDGVNVCEYDPVTRKGRLIFCNDRFVEMSGYTREQLEKAEDLHPFRRSHLTPEQREEKHKCLVSGEPYRGTGSWLRPDGKENTFEFSSVATKVGDKYHVLGFDRDITDRLRAEREFRQSEARFRRLLDTVFDGLNICEYDPVTRGSRLIFCNDRFVEMSGYTREQLERAQDLRPFRQAHLTPEQFSEKHDCLVSGRPYRGTASWIRPDGKENTFEFSSVAIKVGDKYHVLGFDRDITDRLRAERALRQSEARFRQLVDAAFEGVDLFEYDPVMRTGRLIFFNDSFVEMSGYTREQLEEAENWLSLIRLHATPERLAGIRESIVRGLPYQGTASWIRPDGKENTFEFSSVAIKVGDKYHVLGFDRDITDRLRAERALRESEERYRTLVENLNVGVFRVSMTPEGRRGDANRALANMFGCDSVEELMQWAGSCPELMDDVNRLVEAIGNEHSVKDHERTEPTKDGRRIVVSVTANAQSDESGRVRWVAGVVEDVTERRRAEEALRRSEEKYRFLVENAGVPILVFTHDGLLTTMNLMAGAYFGGNPEDFAGKTMWDLFPKDIADIQMGQVRQAIESGQPLVADGVTTIAGDRKWYSAHLQPLREGQGAARTVQVVVHDITERMLAEEELLAYQGQLRSLAADLLATEERERQRIASDLHDNIGQALAMAAMKAGALKRFAASPKLSEGLDDVVALVQQALEGSRTLTAELSPPILDEVAFEAALQWLAEDAEDRYGLAVDFEADGEQGPLDDGTRAVLFRAVRELLVNVVKHAQATRARLSVSRDEDEVEVAVKDDGVGFEPSATASRSAGKGGFGLFSIREQLRQVGGRLEVASQPGRGTVVRLLVPAESQSPRPHRAAW